VNSKFKIGDFVEAITWHGYAIIVKISGCSEKNIYFYKLRFPSGYEYWYDEKDFILKAGVTRGNHI